MEIYKLKDEVPERRKRGADESRGVGGRNAGMADVDRGDTDGKLVVTEMKAGVKNPERVNVFVNSQFAFSLDVAQVVDYKLKVGVVLDETRFEELRKASEFGKLYQRTLEWVLLRPRSMRETREYLYRKLKVSSSGRSLTEVSEISQAIIDRLCEKGYIDDRKFAEFWVENRFVKKGVSQKRLRMELMKKGISQEVIDEVLDGRSDEDELRKMIAKKRSKYDDPQKLVAYLCRQGFSYDLVRRMVEEED